MQTRTVRSVLTVAVAALLAACLQAQAPAPAVAALQPRVAAFLDTWLVRGNPRGAVAEHLSARVADERLIPAEFYAPAEYRSLMANPGRSPLTRATATDRFQQVMNEWSAPRPTAAAARADVLAAIGPDAQPELWNGLRSIDITPTEFREIPALAYRLRDLSSYEWVTPATEGYRTLVPQMIAGGLHVQGVVTRIRTRNTSKAWMLFMFWANEGTDVKPDWKLLGLAPVPTE
jgi:hypothetical protein